MTPMMTDQEIVATWMEPKPGHSREHRPGHPWWKWNETLQEWVPNVNTLDSLHLIEERLLAEQWKPYVEQILKWKSLDKIYVEQLFWLLHATADQKICALATVLRAEVE